MGQYTQWIATQEADRRLRSEIETLETELFYVQDRITILEQVVPATENVILQALAAQLVRGNGSGEQARSFERRASVTGKLPEMGGLYSTPPVSQPFAPHEMPEDMLAFFDRRSQDDPRVSAMLQRERERAHGRETTPPWLNDETRRLNENIERWFRRWHPEAVAEESEHDS